MYKIVPLIVLSVLVSTCATNPLNTDPRMDDIEITKRQGETIDRVCFSKKSTRGKKNGSGVAIYAEPISERVVIVRKKPGEWYKLDLSDNQGCNSDRFMHKNPLRARIDGYAGQCLDLYDEFAGCDITAISKWDNSGDGRKF